MAYDETLADRVREIIAIDHKNVEEKKMFGGLCFMVNDKMCVGVESERLMVRLDPNKYDEVIEKEGNQVTNYIVRVIFLTCPSCQYTTLLYFRCKADTRRSWILYRGV